MPRGPLEIKERSSGDLTLAQGGVALVPVLEGQM